MFTDLDGHPISSTIITNDLYVAAATEVKREAANAIADQLVGHVLCHEVGTAPPGRSGEAEMERPGSGRGAGAVVAESSACAADRDAGHAAGVASAAGGAKWAQPRAAGRPPRRRREYSWRTFTRAYAESLLACRFFHVDLANLTRVYVFFAMDVRDRIVHIHGVEPHPTGEWTV